jgi:hypothetical protein
VCSLAIVHITKVTNAWMFPLVTSTYHVMWCLTECVFLFSTLRTNGRPHLLSKISLLPSSLIDPMTIGGITIDSNCVPKSTDCSMQSCLP